MYTSHQSKRKSSIDAGNFGFSVAVVLVTWFVVSFTWRCRNLPPPPLLCLCRKVRAESTGLDCIGG